MARNKTKAIHKQTQERNQVINKTTTRQQIERKHKLENGNISHGPAYHPKKHKYYYGTQSTIIQSKLDKSLKDFENENLASENNSEHKLTESMISEADELEFSIGKVSKHRLTEREELLLKKFDQEILNSERTKPMLENLTGNTFKSYSTDMKRFIKFCAGQGKNDFLLEESILSKFLISEFKKRKDKVSATKFRNLRSSLLKFHQLTSLVYDVKYSEGEIVYFINNVKEVPQDTAEEKLLSKLQQMYENTNLLLGLSDASKKLYSNEYNRYARFCAREGLDHFHLTGELLKKFFVNDIINRSPNISGKKLQEILSRLNRLHAINVEIFSNYPREIKDIHIVKQYLKEYKSKEVSSAMLSPAPSTEIEQSKSTAQNIPEFVMNRNISTVTQLIEEWEMILQRNEKWGLGWIKSAVDSELYDERELVVSLIDELLLEMNDDIEKQDKKYHVASVLDTYMTRKKISLNDLIQKIKKYPVYSKREFLRILTLPRDDVE